MVETTTTEATCVFAAVVTREEWAAVPRATAKKIEAFVGDKFDELISLRALNETIKRNAEKTEVETKKALEIVTLENQELKTQLERASATISELEAQISNITSDFGKLQSNCNELETEAAKWRHERNLAEDERHACEEKLHRRDIEIDRLKSDLETMTKQLESAINAKCEALAKIDEVESIKLRLDYREKRMDQERQILTNQVDTLTEDFNNRTEELLNIRRDNSTRCIQLETKLAEKTQELVVAQEQIKSLTEINNKYTTRCEELAQKLMDQRGNEAKVNESYLHEIDAKTKLANAYKSMADESKQHADGLQEAMAEVQRLLQHATAQYGELETKFKESELAHEEMLAKKNECIALLKRELELAKELVDSGRMHRDQVQKDMENLSPTAAMSSTLLRSGMTVTEIYSQYVEMSERIVDVEKQNAHLKNSLTKVVQEVEEKGPLVERLKRDFGNALDANEALKEANEQLANELQRLREANAECSRLEDAVARENARLKKEVADLGRQVCHLIQEVDNSRIGSSSASTDMDLSDSVSSADIITKKLVTFNDICELQKNNQKLLAIVRELTERQEEAEAFDPAVISDMKLKLDQMRDGQTELLQERDRQNKMMATLSSQRDMYKSLYNQAVRGVGGGSGDDMEVPEKDTDSSDKNESVSSRNSGDKTQELLAQVDSYKKKIELLKTENDNYRTERTANEKILLEQLEKQTAEVKQLVTINCKLSAQVENCEEKFKVSQNNIEIYKKQIAALEKQNRIYSETIAKHEQSVTMLNESAMQSQTKLSRAEVMLANLQKENALLRDAEGRLLKERENLKRESHTHAMMQTNLELIKATLERSDAEGKLRLEKRLDDAHQECSALRRRFQEEQDRFRQLADHLKNETKVAQERMEEERSEARKLRQELAHIRGELVAKANQVEDLSKKLKAPIYAISESNIDARKMAEFEQKIADGEAEITALQLKLKTAKDASDQYFNVAQSAEGQMKLLLEQQQQYKSELEEQKSIVEQLKEKLAELEGELSIVQDEDQATSTRVLSSDLQSATKEVDVLRNDVRVLSDSLKAVENKYAREVMLHSSDLQKLTDMKQQLEQALVDINEVRQARDAALATLEENKSSWEMREKIIQNEKDELDRRFKDMDSQNGLLLDQIQAINTQLCVLQAQSSADLSNQSLNQSGLPAEDEVKSSDQLLTIIKYLRQEKDIAVSKAEIMEAEYERLKSQFEQTAKQLGEAKSLVESERQRSEVSVVTAAKHADILRKVETLNAITDSNRALRHERDSLRSQVDDLRAQCDRLATELVPLQDKNRELNVKAEAMQTENISLRAECTRWRQRAQLLIEKSNRTSPEDWKKLQGERETLAKQLTVERGNVAKLNDELNHLRQERNKFEEQVRSLRAQNNTQNEEIGRLRDEVASLQSQLSQVQQNLSVAEENNRRMTEENRVLTEDTAGKDVNITELKNNLTQIRKIAKKYKIQCEDQIKEIKTLKEEQELRQNESSTSAEERQNSEQRASELENRVQQLEEDNREAVASSTQQISSLSEENENHKKEIENLKQSALDREERFKSLFKNAKDRIVNLTEQLAQVKSQVENQDGSSSSTSAQGAGQDGGDSSRNDLLNKIDNLEKEKVTILAERRQETERYASEIEALMQKVTQLQRQVGQQGSKPSTSSISSEKPATEPPTANIKPMAGHSTNTQTQSVPIHPWRSAGETPLASIRPMSAQLRTVTVLPTSQSPSAVMVPPQQQVVHTTGSGGIEALSSSPTSSSSHTDYVPATSSATSMSVGPSRQVVVPPTQSSQDAGEEEVPVPQTQQAVAMVLPRVEPPSGTQEQGTSSGGSSNTVTTTQAGHKRQRDEDQSDDQTKTQQQSKRTRIQLTAASGSGSVDSGGLEVEYQVPTSSQRDHDDDPVIVVESDEEGGADEGEGEGDDDEPDDPDTEGYMDMEEGMEQDNYDEDVDDDDVEEEEEGGNEVEVIEDSSEVPNQSSERSSVQEAGGSRDDVEEEEEESGTARPEATSSGADGGGVTVSQASTSAASSPAAAAGSASSRVRPVAPLPSSARPSHHHQHHHHHHLQHLYHHHHQGMDEGGLDDGIVPSTPTLFVPRRTDGFGEAVGSPRVPNSGGGVGGGGGGGRLFTFGEAASAAALAAAVGGAAGVEGVPEQTLEVVAAAILDDNSTGRSVPSTPLQSSPQEAIPGVEDQGTSSQTTHSDAEIPSITVSAADDDDAVVVGESTEGDEDDAAPPQGSEDAMGPPAVAGTSSSSSAEAATQQSSSSSFSGMGQAEESEGFDLVTSEGEKPPNPEGEGEEEGREAEASPSTNTRSRSTRGGVGGPTARRSSRPIAGARGSRAGGPTPIVWGGQQHQQQQQRHSDGGFRGRPHMQQSPLQQQQHMQQQMYNSPRMARRARGRPPRGPYGRF